MPLRGGRRAVRGRLLPLVGVATFGLIGCGGPTSTVAIPSASGPGVTGSSPSALPLAIDLCALLTQQEAATMMGVALSRGRLTAGECFFSGYTPSASVTIQVDLGASQGDAKAAFETSLARIPPTWTVTHLPTVGDGATIARISGGGSALSVIFVVDSAVFFSVICEDPACTDTALKPGANIIARRLPIGTTQETRAVRPPSNQRGETASVSRIAR
jgi:hypothetical protein